MTSVPHDTLPTVIVTSVIRSTNQGQSHGGVYLVDLNTGASDQVLDWSDAGIDWEGRGGDRGLRGVAFADNTVYLAASDEVFCYDASFNRIGVIEGNRYLKHCHEIAIGDGHLWLTSAGHDCVLGYDLATGRYAVGYELRYRPVIQRAKGLIRRLPKTIGDRMPIVRPTFRVFDPNGAGGPVRRDTSHINSVTVRGGSIYFSGTQLHRLYEIRGRRHREYGAVPAGTHNAQPFGPDRIIANDTASDRVVILNRHGDVQWQSPLPSYPEQDLECVPLAGGNARQSFGRGLAMWADRYVITGSSPATVTVHDLRTSQPVRQINLTMDVRNAIHGLEIWPFSPRR